MCFKEGMSHLLMRRLQMNLPKTDDIRQEFLNLYKSNSVNEEGLLELVGVSFIADEFEMFGETSMDYAMREHKWYMSQSLSVHDIEYPIPTIWSNIADKNGLINSNYGFLAFSEENGNQFKNAVKSLKQKSASRQAIMIYTRPSIHTDAFIDGRQDFICTNTQQFMLRNNKLDIIVNQRSCDAIYGFRYDMRWAYYLLKRAALELEGVEVGNVILQTGSIHIYPRHFKLLEEYKNENR